MAIVEGARHDIDEETNEYDQQEQIDYALSNSPYLVNSGGAPVGTSDSNSINNGSAYNFGYNSMQNGVVPLRC